MAASVTSGGQATSTVAGATLTSSANLTAAIGDYVVVLVAASNDGSGGAASISATMTDSDGVNVYTRRALINHDPGAAGGGATLAIFTAPVTDALTSAQVTANFSPDTDQRAMQVYSVTPGASEVISFRTVDTTGETGSVTTHSAATVACIAGDIIFCGAAIEANDAITGDADTTNGSWNSVTRLADGGTDATAMTCHASYKIVTGAGDQSWAATTANARDSARTYLILNSVVPATYVMARRHHHYRQMHQR
jgi:hypothetical protein